MTKQQHIKVKLIRSISGRKSNHQACVAGLGLRRIHQEVVVEDTPSNRGMINKVSYLLEITEG